jgi:hypothetical protein
MTRRFFKNIALFCAVLGAGLVSMAASATDVGISVRISQPGVYGRVDIGRFPQPQVWLPQPVWVTQPVVVVQQPPPVYLWVPLGHRKHWSKHCGRYGACGHPVYFVRDDWYGQHVRPIRYQGHGTHGDRWRGEQHGLRAEGVRDAWHGDGEFHDHGPGHGNGPGKGHDKGHDKGHGHRKHER